LLVQHQRGPFAALRMWKWNWDAGPLVGGQDQVITPEIDRATITPARKKSKQGRRRRRTGRASAALAGWVLVQLALWPGPAPQTVIGWPLSGNAAGQDRATPLALCPALPLLTFSLAGVIGTRCRSSAPPCARRSTGR
jgi:hypothetical protein